LGHAVTICTYRTGEDISGLGIVRTPGIPWRRSYEVGSSLHKLAFDALLLATSLRCTLRERPDIIHAHLHEGALIGHALSRLWRVPLIFDFQGSLTGEMMDHGFLAADSVLRGPVLWLEKYIDQLPDAIVVSSEHAAQLLVRDFACPPAKIHVVPDSVDTDTPLPPDHQQEVVQLRRQLGVVRTKQVVVYLGLLAEYQGIGLLLQAAQAVLGRDENVHFLIMGHPNVEHYEGLAGQMGLSGQVTFTGRIPYSDAHRYLRLGDVAVAPKISATEGAGKLPNYMAMGLPTVAFDTPVSREYLGEWGIYAELGDAHSLARGILSLLQDRERRAKVGGMLRERAVGLYSWSRFQDQLRELYTAVLVPR
jgi:glycosyltransferase involved in cell wall biosynthesis